MMITPRVKRPFTPIKSSLLLGALFTSLLAAPAAQACQLVCFTTPYALAGAADTTAARNAACEAAKHGFKPPLPGMMAALPGDQSAFNGAKGGLSCSDIIPGVIAQAEVATFPSDVLDPFYVNIMQGAFSGNFAASGFSNQMNDAFGPFINNVNIAYGSPLNVAGINAQNSYGIPLRDALIASQYYTCAASAAPYIACNPFTTAADATSPYATAQAAKVGIRNALITGQNATNDPFVALVITLRSNALMAAQNALKAAATTAGINACNTSNAASRLVCCNI